MVLLNKKKGKKLVEKRDVKPYYVKEDIEFKSKLSKEEEKEIRSALFRIINMTDKQESIRAYYQLLTNYGEENVSYVIRTTKIKSEDSYIKDSLAYDDFLDLLKTKWAVPFIAILGFDKRYDCSSAKGRKENALYGKDYILFDRKESDTYEDYKMIYYSCTDLRNVYALINQAIIYDMEDVLEENISFILAHPCYHWLFLEYPSLNKYSPKQDEPTKTYVRKRTK